ncbi:MAG: patatin-like phospholipase family protein [Candidatus Omnitrophica bacterium]|nr:patatin-like phospholipase family protein [Candidatus Omnitrophota bacterium]
MDLFGFDKLSIIDQHPLFRDLSVFQKITVASKAHLMEYPKGEVIYKEGDPPDYFYSVVSGRVEIYHPWAKSASRRETRLEVVRKGDYFGMISAITGGVHTVSARTMNDSVVLRIKTSDFSGLLAKMPKLSTFLNHALSRRLGRKAVKEVFETRIVSVYIAGERASERGYAEDLAGNIRKGSGKKVAVIRSGAFSNAKEVSAKLSGMTGEYHYVIVEITRGDGKINEEILEQSDTCHIFSSGDMEAIKEANLTATLIENSFKKYSGQAVRVVIDDQGYSFQVSRLTREITGTSIGLALGAGAAVGVAHIGVLKVIEKENIPIDMISGCSMGAIIAAMWASGTDAVKIEKFLSGFNSALKTLFLIDPTLPVKGLIKGKAVRKVLTEYLGEKTFDDVRVPLRIVACDIAKRREYVLDKGRLVDAVMASIAIPGIFEPFVIDGVQLVDGGVIDPVPVDVLVRSGVKKVIAVNALPSSEEMTDRGGKQLNLYDVIVNSLQVSEYTIAMYSCQRADVYLHPVPKQADWFEFHRAGFFVKIGEEETRRKLPEIRALLQEK